MTSLTNPPAQYEFPIANAYVATMEGAPKPKVHLSEEDIANGVTEADVIAQSKTEADRDADDVPLKATEKRRLNWTGKPYLVRLCAARAVQERLLTLSCLSVFLVGTLDDDGCDGSAHAFP